MKSSHQEDRRLLSRCFSGDRKAAEILVRRFSGLVYRSVQTTLLSGNVSLDQPMLEDFHNTVFLQLFENSCKKLRQYQGKNGCSLATWIRLVAVRIVLNHLRKKGFDAVYRQKHRRSLDDLPELRSAEMGAAAAVEKAEQVRLLQTGLQNLPPQGRLFMKLHLDQGLPVNEVAAAMQISVQNAYTIKHRAIQKLKAYIDRRIG
jgi:RNA polymerase sigma factor (sigma-70 family)